MIGGKYELALRIGEGGMSEVWRARHLSLRHDVAIKFATGELDDAFAARFEREALVLARLSARTSHVARVTDFATEPSPYLVMELLRGEALHELLRARKRFTAAEVSWVVSHLAAGLTAIHRAGVVHRDIKPANIFVHREPGVGATVKLLDFGIAKAALGNELDAATQRGTILGTVHYMSPEQLLGDRAVDARTDLWGLGVVAYRMLLGQMPLPTTENMFAALTHAPTRPSSLEPGLAPALDAWVERALARAPEDRFRSADEMYESLHEALGRPAEQEVPPVERAETTGSAATIATQASVRSRSSGHATRRVGARSAIAGVLVVGVAVGSAWALSRADATDPCLTLGADLVEAIPPFASPSHVVDGSDDDFCGVPAMALAIEGDALVPTDRLDEADAIVRVAWSTAALHVFVHVVDTDVRPNAHRPYLGDALEVFAASTEELAGAYDGSDAAGSVQVLAAVDSIVRVYPAEAAALFPAFEAATLSVDGGYVIEMSIPWRWPDRITIDARIGFDLALDSATGETQFAQALLCNEAVTPTVCSPGDAHPHCDNRTWCRPRLRRG